MMIHRSKLSSRVCLLAAALLAIGATARSAETNTLKNAYKDNFYVGVAINGRVYSSRGGPSRDADLVKIQFNQIVSENDCKWESIQPRSGPDGYNFGPADAFVNYGLANNMYIVGHTLVWHSQTPGWVFQGTNMPAVNTNAVAGAGRRGGRGGGGRGGATGPRASRDELLQRMHDHISTVVGRYKGKIKVWDVVNEALSDGGQNILRDSPWSQIIGQDFIAKAFQYAHEADPDAILRYNDYGLENPQKRRKLITLITQLKSNNIPVMAIGSQTHVSVSSPSFEAEDRALTEIEQLGLPIHITELDVNGAQGGQRGMLGDTAGAAAASQGGLVSNADQRLATEYDALFRAFAKHKLVKVVTFWGVNDSVSWLRNANPLLFDANDQPKAAFDAVIKAATAGQTTTP